ncbi:MULTISPECIES: ATP-binding protein [Anaeromyxobacter]|uniref:sensor histidine kinase n=1 Tax=Anaeromyxobacter TaxID=161492 RepID=UPI001F568E36|nr:MULTISPECIES: ATP-binding protein [unclassified Anaeromyxobacter]
MLRRIGERLRSDTVVARYGLAVTLATAAIGLTLVLSPVFPHTLTVLALGAVAVSTATCGAGPGVLVIVLVVGWFTALVAPTLDRGEALHFVLFALVGALIVRTSGSARASLRAAVGLRREGARRVRARLESLRAVTRAVDEGVYAIGRDGRITYLNAAAERMLGYRSKELVGLEMKAALRCNRIEGTCSGKTCRLLNVMATGQPHRGADDTLTRKDGSCFPVRYSSAPITRGGRIVGAAIAFQDITEERRAAKRERFLAIATEQLASSLGFDETLARSARVALPHLGDWCAVVLAGECGAAGRVAVEALDPARAHEGYEILRRTPVAPLAEDGFGIEVRTSAPELIREVDNLSDHDGSTARAREELLRRVGVRSFMSVPLRARDRVLGTMDFGIAGSSRRFDAEDLGVATELARRCALAIDNARLYQQAQDAIRARDDTLAIVSHDLRNPLSAIRMAASVAAGSTAPGTPARKASQSIERVCNRMNRLIGDLVDLASIDAGRLSILRTAICPAGPVDDAVDAIRPLAEQLGVRLELDLAVDPPRVWGDRDRLQQVLVNLLSNAVKVSARGASVRLRSRALPGTVVFSVSDRGPGIPLEHQARIFDRYWRDPSVRYTGTGLGLSIARGIIEAHGGRLWVVSRPGAGATLRFTIPLAPEAEVAEPERAPRAPGAGAAPEVGASRWAMEGDRRGA